MARTPLLRGLVRALRQARDASRSQVPVRELVETRAAEALTRRRFLAASAAVAAPVLVGCSPEPRTPAVAARGARVAIVGAGLAGLHAAHRLKRLGVEATVYDAAERVGGRVFTDRRTFPEGMHGELGGELIDSGHQTMLDLAAELGIDLYDYANDDPSLEKLCAWFGGHRLTEAAILDGFMPIAQHIDAALATLRDRDDPWVYWDDHRNGDALDALSLAEWLDRAGARGPVRDLLETAYVTEYGLDADHSDCLNLLFLVSTDTKAFEVFGDSDERFHAKTGNEAFAERLAASLDPERIRRGSRLEAVSRAADGRYALTFAEGASAKEVVADHVVFALPFTMLRRVDLRVALPPVKARAIRELGYGTNTKMMCGFSSRPWRERWRSDGSAYADTFQSTWETSRLQPGKSGIITHYTGGSTGVAIGQGTPAERMAAFLAQFDALFPGAQAASNGKVARMHWPSHAFTLGSYSAYLVGQYGAFSGAEIGRVGNIHFCGEHTSLDAQGYMEGAALTGAMAADEVAEDLGVAAKTMAVAPEPSLPYRASDPTIPASRILARARAARVFRRWSSAPPAPKR